MKIIISAVSLAIASSFAVADEKIDAMRLVGKAVVAIGKDKVAALSEIGKKDGAYVNGSVYVFAYDLTGTMVAHPINSAMVGKNLINEPDADGKLFRKEIIDGVKAQAAVNVEYKYRNPKTGLIENKATHCQRSTDVILCAGYYKL